MLGIVIGSAATLFPHYTLNWPLPQSQRSGPRELSLAPSGLCSPFRHAVEAACILAEEKGSHKMFGIVLI